MIRPPLSTLLAALPLLGPPYPVSPPAGLEVVLRQEVVWVAMDISDFHTNVDVFLGERGPFRFQVDTHASVELCLDDDLVRELLVEERGGNLALRYLDGPWLEAVPPPGAELAFERCAMGLEQQAEKDGTRGALVLQAPDLTGTWFAPERD